MEIYDNFTDSTWKELKTIYFKNSIWAFRNSITWFILFGDEDSRVSFVPIDYCTTGKKISKNFTDEIKFRKRIEENQGNYFKLYKFDNFLEFTEFIKNYQI